MIYLDSDKFYLTGSMDLILIKSESRFSINRKKIKTQVRKVLKSRRIFSDLELSIAFVGRRKMRRLNREFREIDQAASVLSFSQLEKGAGERFVNSPGRLLRLGDIVVCYPVAQELADKEGVLVDEEIDYLIEHGLLNLLKINS